MVEWLDRVVVTLRLDDNVVGTEWLDRVVVGLDIVMMMLGRVVMKM